MSFSSSAGYLLGLSVFAALAGCAPDTQVARVDAGHGRTLFAEKCAACHGPKGQGAGPAAVGLSQTPPPLTGLSQRNGGTFPRDYVMGVIDGFTRRSHLGSAMPEFGADGLGALIMVEENGISTPTPSDLLALASFIETLQE
ncbi:MAG: mono/diheme cytochrome c family protein [Paracoccaceae bacterium]|mgnify:CR=1 FL=1|jgi:mono/diheme cytochrome c family protein